MSETTSSMMAGRNFMPAGYSAHSLESWTLRTPGALWQAPGRRKSAVRGEVRTPSFPKLSNRIPGQVGVRKRLDPNYGHAHPGMQSGRLGRGVTRPDAAFRRS
jgi:hypothetical protein